MDGGYRPESLRLPDGGGVPRCRIAAGVSERPGGVRPGHRASNGDKGRLRLHRTGEPVGRHGTGPVRERAGGKGCPGPVRGCLPRGERGLPAGRDVRPRRGEWRPGRHRLGAAGPVCAGVRPDGPLGQRGHRAQRRAGTQRGGDCGGARGRGPQPGGRHAVCRRTRHAAVRHPAGRDGSDLRPGGTREDGGRGAERVVQRRRAKHCGGQRRPHSGQRAGCRRGGDPGPIPSGRRAGKGS